MSSQEDDYDPRKPEFIQPASEDEVASAQIELLRRQSRSLESMLRSREALEPDAEVLRFYRGVILDLGRQIRALESPLQWPCEGLEDDCSCATCTSRGSTPSRDLAGCIQQCGQDCAVQEVSLSRCSAWGQDEAGTCGAVPSVDSMCRCPPRGSPVDMLAHWHWCSF